MELEEKSGCWIWKKAGNRFLAPFVVILSLLGSGIEIVAGIGIGKPINLTHEFCKTKTRPINVGRVL